MLARDRDACRMNNVRLDPARAQPAREPEAITARLEGNGDAPDGATGLGRLIPPALQQSEQRCFVRLQLLQRMTANARHDARDQPAGLAHFDDRQQCIILLKGGEGSAQVVRLSLRHGVLSVGVSSEMLPPSSRRPPIVSGKPGRGATLLKTISSGSSSTAAWCGCCLTARAMKACRLKISLRPATSTTTALRASRMWSVPRSATTLKRDVG